MRHVRAIFMAAVVLPPRELSVNQPDIDAGHDRGVIVVTLAEIASAEQTEHRPGGDRRHVAALVIEPVRIALLGNPVADEYPPWSDQRDQFVRIDGQVSGSLAAKRRVRGSVPEKVAR